MNILILGATGMAGHMISLYLKETGHNVVAFTRKEFIYCTNIIGDIFDYKYIKCLLEDKRYDAVINCVGILNNDAEHYKDQAIYINSYLPHLLVSITNELPTKVIHLSTDCVFSGKKGCYVESDMKDGKSEYALTKSLGEIIDNKNLTIRTSIIGPDIQSEGIGLLNWFMKQDSRLKGYQRVIWSGVTTLELARAITELLNQNISGLYHLVNNKSINKYDLLQLFNKHLRDDSVNIDIDNSIISDKSLLNTRQDFNYIIPDYEHMIIDLKKWIQNHIELYPDYYKNRG